MVVQLSRRRSYSARLGAAVADPSRTAGENGSLEGLLFASNGEEVVFDSLGRVVGSASPEEPVVIALDEFRGGENVSDEGIAPGRGATVLGSEDVSRRSSALSRRSRSLSRCSI